jgi:hypothetical protein
MTSHVTARLAGGRITGPKGKFLWRVMSRDLHGSLVYHYLLQTTCPVCREKRKQLKDITRTIEGLF